MVAGCVAALGFVLVTAAVPVGAHTPHDVIADVAVSPAFAKDRTVFALSDNGSIHLSEDDGATFRMVGAGPRWRPGHRHGR